VREEEEEEEEVQIAPQHVQHEKDQMHHLYKLCEHPVLAPETTGMKS